jgi:hypothetical protein
MLRPALALLALTFALAACGSGGSTSSSDAAQLTPAAYVKRAATKTAAAPSEHMTMKGSITVNGQQVTLNGGGNFDNEKRVGSLHLEFNAAGLTGAIDEIVDGTTVYVQSPLFADALPKGKTWMKIDLQRAVASQGIDFSALGAQDPAQTMAQLRGLKNVRDLGTEEVGGADTTHYRGRIDLAKVPQGEKLKALTNATYGPYDVWVGKDDGYVRRVSFSFATLVAGTTKQRVALTSEFSDFGKGVSITIPAASEAFDATNQTITGLGG